MTMPLVTYSPPIIRNDHTISHVRISGRRSYLCDPETKNPPPFRILVAEDHAPAAKVCRQCGPLLNALIETLGQ